MNDVTDAYAQSSRARNFLTIAIYPFIKWIPAITSLMWHTMRHDREVMHLKSHHIVYEISMNITIFIYSSQKKKKKIPVSTIFNSYANIVFLKFLNSISSVSSNFKGTSGSAVNIFSLSLSNQFRLNYNFQQCSSTGPPPYHPVSFCPS